MRKINKRFVSEIDKKLREFDQKNQRSASQQAEIAKYNDINNRRDNPAVSPTPQGDIWGSDAY